MRALLDRAVSDERAVGRGVGVDQERWSSPDHSVVDDRFLVASDRAALEAYVAEATADAALRLPTGVEVRTQAIAAVPVRWRTFAVVARPTLDSSAIRRTSVRQMPAGDLVVELALDDAGRSAFAALTRQLVGQKLALIVDGVISSAPVVMGEIGGGKLYVAVAPGDRAGDDALRTAEDLAVTLGSGPLPGRLLLETSAPSPGR
jgi:preprotein translocase subunit SecD